MKEINTKVPIYNLDAQVVDYFELDKELFDGKINNEILYQAVKMYEANPRRGTASTKRRGEVAGGGIKPWKQKGTGRARVGSTRNPLWRHGGVVFGPKPHSFSYALPKKMLKKALVSSINARLTEGKIYILLKAEIKAPKTKEFKNIIDKFKLEGKTLFAMASEDSNIKLAARNLRTVTFMEGRNINARDILVNENFMIEKEAFLKITERLK
ncbi:Ribosomal protein L4/L1e, bacterial-type [Candidatus Omnitrophus magneticus]|uniref:Large ribosomal subunit protein uL4 n=1 Tax=Candidatus Omnitrophus magneticus TaxID=1609969 RepID=A0A0F0CS40_9BACT|nr:Ribosomal protein L4/L1e, bacterial-type [Candidatus Omnitrophus magneticus]